MCKIKLPVNGPVHWSDVHTGGREVLLHVLEIQRISDNYAECIQQLKWFDNYKWSMEPFHTLKAKIID